MCGSSGRLGRNGAGDIQKPLVLESGRGCELAQPAGADRRGDTGEETGEESFMKITEKLKFKGNGIFWCLAGIFLTGALPLLTNYCLNSSEVPYQLVRIENMKDYLSAIDDISKEPYVDTNRLGCVGASFGGFSVYWLAGHHDKRFKAFIAHDGIFNMEQQYLETEEMWFANWDMGGAYWDKNNATAQRTFANSPHRFVDKWDTPILCIHGEKDYRILASQGMSAFNAAVLRGVPAELLLYPDENHWVLKPQNGVLWQRTFFSWLDKWLK